MVAFASVRAGYVEMIARQFQPVWYRKSISIGVIFRIFETLWFFLTSRDSSRLRFSSKYSTPWWIFHKHRIVGVGWRWFSSPPAPKRDWGKTRSSSVVLRDFCSLPIRAHCCRTVSSSVYWKLLKKLFDSSELGCSDRNIAYSLTSPENFGILGFSILKLHVSFLITSTLSLPSLTTSPTVEKLVSTLLNSVAKLILTTLSLLVILPLVSSLLLVSSKLFSISLCRFNVP